MRRAVILVAALLCACGPLPEPERVVEVFACTGTSPSGSCRVETESGKRRTTMGPVAVGDTISICVPSYVIGSTVLWCAQ